MRAAVLHAPRTPGRPEDLRIQDVPVPEPRDGEVLVRTHTCGICASDLHVVQGVTPTSRLPMVLGHEVAGTVADVGPGVTGWGDGDRVLVRPQHPCGVCAVCRDGRDNICPNADILSITVDGGQAEYLAVTASALLPIPAGIPMAHASILADAVATPYHALKRGGLRAGQTCVVVGLGGLGAHAVALAKLIGATVVGIDTDPVARDRALAFGADHVVDGSRTDLVVALRELTEGGADASFEFVGVAATVKLAAACLRPGGRATLVGIGRDRLTASPLGIFNSQELEIVGSFGQTRRDIEELLDMVVDGRLDLGRSVTHELPLEEVHRGLMMLETREDHPLRIVLRLADG